MTNDELADKIAGLPPIRILLKILIVLIPIALVFSILAAHYDKRHGRLKNDPLDSMAIQVKKTESVQNNEGINSYIVKRLKEMFSFRHPLAIVHLILTILTTTFLIWYTHKNSLKRRKIFLKNFKLEDLKSAPHCSIQRINRLSGLIKTTKNLSNWTGSIFKVLEHKDVYVIFNESPFKFFKRLVSKNKGYQVGVLLNYEGHHFFFCSSWIPDFDFGE